MTISSSLYNISIHYSPIIAQRSFTLYYRSFGDVTAIRRLDPHYLTATRSEKLAYGDAENNFDNITSEERSRDWKI